MNLTHSQVIVCDDFEEMKDRFKRAYEPQQLAIFESDEFKVEDAKAAIKAAMVRSSEPKALVLMANKFNTYAQNALLKILEEPPQNIRFFLVSKTRSTFLPTILSRLPITKVRSESSENGYTFERFDLERLYELAKLKPSKAQTKAILKGMLAYAVEKELPLKERELDYFAKALELTELNSNPSNLFITAGLIILRARKR